MEKLKEFKLKRRLVFELTKYLGIYDYGTCGELIASHKEYENKEDATYNFHLMIDDLCRLFKEYMSDKETK